MKLKNSTKSNTSELPKKGLIFSKFKPQPAAAIADTIGAIHTLQGSTGGAFLASAKAEAEAGKK